jgi:hypothetical protein
VCSILRSQLIIEYLFLLLEKISENENEELKNKTIYAIHLCLSSLFCMYHCLPGDIVQVETWKMVLQKFISKQIKKIYKRYIHNLIHVILQSLQ